MSVVRSLRASVTGDVVTQWLPVGLRAVAAVVLLPAGLVKIVRYGPQAARFAELGVPSPAATLVVVAVVELVTALALVFGAASRLAALVVVTLMVGTVAFVGVVPSNSVLLLASCGIVALGPGNYAVWTPGAELLGDGQ